MISLAFMVVLLTGVLSTSRYSCPCAHRSVSMEVSVGRRETNEGQGLVYSSFRSQARIQGGLGDMSPPQTSKKIGLTNRPKITAPPPPTSVCATLPVCAPPLRLSLLDQPLDPLYTSQKYKPGPKLHTS